MKMAKVKFEQNNYEHENLTDNFQLKIFKKKFLIHNSCRKL